MIIALAIGLLALLYLLSRVMGFPLPIVDVEFYGIGGPQGHGPGGPGGTVTASPMPSGLPSAGDSTGLSPLPGQSGTASAPAASGNEIPVISERVFSGGSATVDVSGSFELHSTLALTDLALDSSDGVETSLSYEFNRDSGGVSLGFSHREGADGLGLNVNLGPWMATYLGADCSWQVEVTSSTVSGHISCHDISAVNSDDETQGSVDIELDFTADS
jgi:hypothetical protein